MSVGTYLKRFGKYIIKGIPVKKVYVSINTVENGKQLEGEKVVVTGGTSGIGYAIAKRFITEGAEVIVVGRSKNKLKATKESLGDRCIVYYMDLIDFSVFQEKIDEIADIAGGRIDILVNNAGIYYPNKIDNVTEKDWDDLLDTNLKSPYFVTKHFLKYMSENSRIIMIDSDTAFINSTNPYHIAKIGIDGLTRALAKEYLEKGIRVNAIAPGPTLSNINTTDPRKGLQRNDKFRVLRAEEIAEVALFLAATVSTCINGQTVCCDEGDSLR